MDKKVAVFITCLVDLFRAEVVFATIQLLEEAGCQVDVPLPQTCCGQPAYNSGDKTSAQKIARQTIALLKDYDYIVVPSGSCAAMIKQHYPSLFVDEKDFYLIAQKTAEKTYELTQFLYDILQVKKLDRQLDKKITYHDACSGLRELNIKNQPRHLLNAVAGIKLCEQQDAEVCCGFGGTFCVKYPDISTKMVSDKTNHITASKADIVTAGDLGCLMNIAGKLKREQSSIQVFHIAEVLAGLTEGRAGIAETNPCNPLPNTLKKMREQR
jgi:L-lactate dehydrogenase complex protein LldE